MNTAPSIGSAEAKEILLRISSLKKQREMFAASGHGTSNIVKEIDDEIDRLSEVVRAQHNVAITLVR